MICYIKLCVMTLRLSEGSHVGQLLATVIATTPYVTRVELEISDLEATAPPTVPLLFETFLKKYLPTLLKLSPLPKGPIRFLNYILLLLSSLRHDNECPFGIAQIYQVTTVNHNQCEQ